MFEYIRFTMIYTNIVYYVFTVANGGRRIHVYVVRAKLVIQFVSRTLEVVFIYDVIFYRVHFRVH